MTRLEKSECGGLCCCISPLMKLPSKAGILLQRNPKVFTTASAQEVGDGLCLTLLCRCISLVESNLHPEPQLQGSLGNVVLNFQPLQFRMVHLQEVAEGAKWQSLCSKEEPDSGRGWMWEVKLKGTELWFIKTRLDSFPTLCPLIVSLHGVYNLVHPHCDDEKISSLERVGLLLTVRRRSRDAGRRWALCLHGGVVPRSSVGDSTSRDHHVQPHPSAKGVNLTHLLIISYLISEQWHWESATWYKHQAWLKGTAKEEKQILRAGGTHLRYFIAGMLHCTEQSPYPGAHQ